MIIFEIKKEWPESDETPSFRTNCVDDINRLDQFAKRIASDEAYIFKKCCLGVNAIKEMVKNTMRERRRKLKDNLVYNTASGTETASSSPESSPPLQKKMKYDQYFHPGTYNSIRNYIVPYDFQAMKISTLVEN